MQASLKNLSHKSLKTFEPKPVLNILDDEPQLYQQQLQLWQWIADYYMCSEGEVMQAAMPANLKLSSETILVWNEEHNEDFTDLNDREYIVAEALSIKKELKLSEVQQLLDASHVYPVIKKLIDKKCLSCLGGIERQVQRKNGNIYCTASTIP